MSVFSSAGAALRWAHACYALSGFLALGYQVVWFRVFAASFGSSSLSFAVVLVSFLGGLGVGSAASELFLRRPSFRSAGPRVLRAYGGLELLVALTAALTLLLLYAPFDLGAAFPYVQDGALLRPSSALRFAQIGAGALCVFAPCFAMGATFPLLCAGWRSASRCPSALYASNTLGAAGGVLACELLLLPALGHEQLLLGLIASSAALGLFCLWLPLPGASNEAAIVVGEARAVDASTSSLATREALSPAMSSAAVLTSGFLTGAFEADVLQRLQFLDCRTGAALSCISFWAIVAIFSASLSVRWVSWLRWKHLRWAALLAALLYLATWSEAYPLREWASRGDQRRVAEALPPLPPGLSGSYQFFHFGYGFGALLWFTGLFVLPSFYLLSLLLPYVCNAAQAEGRTLGRLVAWNTLAFGAGALAIGVLAPRVNHFYSLRLFLGVLFLGAIFLALLRVAEGRLVQKALLAGVALLALAVATPQDFAPAWFPPSSPAARHPVRALKSDGAHTTFVVAEPSGDVLYFDSHAMSGCNAAAQQYMRLMAHLPLLAHPAPRRALLICFGVGNTASAIAAHESVERLDIVDLNHQVYATAGEFAATNQRVDRDPRVRLYHDDGRRFLALAEPGYDFVTSEPPPPMMPGVSRLYSVEYYRDVRAVLAPGGLVSQWLPIDQMPRSAMRSAIASFLAVFPEAFLFVGERTNYILVGCKGPLDLSRIEARYAAAPRVAADLARVAIPRPLHLFARITQGPRALAASAGAAPLVSDLRNDFSHLFHEPREPAVLGYDPVALLSELEALAPGLRCRAELGRLVCSLGRLKNAVPDFPEAALRSVAARPEVPIRSAGVDWHVVAARVEASRAASARGDAASAVRQLELALALAPDASYLAGDLALIATRSSQWERSLSYWRLVESLEPDELAGPYGRAFAELQLGRSAEALQTLEALSSRFPREVSVLRLRGEVLAALGRRSEALQAFDRALELAPGDAPTMAARTRVVEGRAR
ncbi:MAG: tetratricopeptide repeat protein [Planctomycetes bacterium]|nr:tetratricopeptide repeat protein [Planctomycetota bacterium]